MDVTKEKLSWFIGQYIQTGKFPEGFTDGNSNFKSVKQTSRIVNMTPVKKSVTITVPPEIMEMAKQLRKAIENV